MLHLVIWTSSESLTGVVKYFHAREPVITTPPFQPDSWKTRVLKLCVQGFTPNCRDFGRVSNIGRNAHSDSFAHSEH
eukprot:scaffold7359_cov254-Ochromonas_danica.AAC.5